MKKHLARPIFAIVGGGLFALAIAFAAVQTASAAGIGQPARMAAHLTADRGMAADHLGGKNVLATAATYIGITEDALRAELQAGKSLAEVAVANGKTRDGLIAALSQAATTAIGTLVDQKGLGGPGGPGGHGRGAKIMSDHFAVAATYLGLPQADLLTRVRAGESLAAIANGTTGKSRDGLVAAIVAEINAKVDAAVTAGTITAVQATELKARATEHATRFVDETRTPGMPGGPGRGRR